MPEANNTEALPEKGPWSDTWENLARSTGTYVENISQSVKKAVKSPLMPWNMDWQALSSQTAKQAATEPPVKVHEFDTVFNSLMGAESNSTHTDASGRLITSDKGAKGITQVMPKTGANPGYGVAPIQNASEEEYRRFGKDYLKAMLREFDGDYAKALSAYNAGAGTVKSAIGKANDKGGDWKDYLPKPQETLPYVNKILGEKGNAKAR